MEDKFRKKVLKEIKKLLKEENNPFDILGKYQGPEPEKYDDKIGQKLSEKLNPEKDKLLKGLYTYEDLVNYAKKLNQLYYVNDAELAILYKRFTQSVRSCFRDKLSLIGQGIANEFLKNEKYNNASEDSISKQISELRTFGGDQSKMRDDIDAARRELGKINLDDEKFKPLAGSVDNPFPTWRDMDKKLTREGKEALGGYAHFIGDNKNLYLAVYTQDGNKYVATWRYDQPNNRWVATDIGTTTAYKEGDVFAITNEAYKQKLDNALTKANPPPAEEPAAETPAEAPAAETPAETPAEAPAKKYSYKPKKPRPEVKELQTLLNQVLSAKKLPTLKPQPGAEDGVDGRYGKDTRTKLLQIIPEEELKPLTIAQIIEKLKNMLGGAPTEKPTPKPTPKTIPPEQLSTGGSGESENFTFANMDFFNDWVAKQKPENLANKTFAVHTGGKYENTIIKYGPDGKPVGEPQKIDIKESWSIRQKNKYTENLLERLIKSL